MSSTEEDEPPAKKAKPAQKKGKMVEPPSEWKDFLELDEYPQPPGSVRAVPPMADVTPSAGLRVRHLSRTSCGLSTPTIRTYCPCRGLYFLKRYTRILRKNRGEHRTEEIRLFDEVKCVYTTTRRWMFVSITAAPFDDSR